MLVGAILIFWCFFSVTGILEIIFATKYSDQSYMIPSMIFLTNDKFGLLLATVIFTVGVGLTPFLKSKFNPIWFSL